MVITHHGNQQVKLQYGDITIAVNPISKDSKLKGAKFGADVALISVNHPDFNGVEQVTFGDKKPFVISGPGEYETKGVFVKGLASTSSYDGKEMVNTIYSFNLDSINVCFLGALGTVEVSDSVNEEIEEVDILFVPIGGAGVLDAHEAYKLAVKFEPKIIIPVGMDGAGASKDALKTFLKESGEEGTKATDKYTVKKKDLEGKEGEVVILSTT